jgi:fructose PTS system EIIA component
VSDFVTADHIMLDQDAYSREDALRKIAEKGAELGITDDADALYKAFLAREGMGETGMTDGFAIPHAKSADIKKAAVVVFKNKTPLDWPSFDEKPVTCAIALMVPDGEAGTEHIRLLSKTAVLLMDAGFKALVRESSDAAEIASAVNRGIEG